MTWRSAFHLASLLLIATFAQAHIGSPDIYLDGRAGPYQLFVTIRPPLVIPGVAELEVRAATPGITELRAVPLPMSGPGAKFTPVADKLTVSPSDKQLFTGSLWMMAPGSWQVRLSASGPQGSGTLAVPVPSAALVTRRMTPGLGALLSCLGLFLVAGVVVMAGASVRESRLDPGERPNAGRIRAGRVAMTVAAVLVIAVLWGGNRWWNNEAASYRQDVYKPLAMRAALAPNGALTLSLSDPGWLKAPGWRSLFTRSVDDLVPDHNHLMHLYAIRQPGLDVVYHLHPEPAGPGSFHLDLPAMPPGPYRLYADIVHANGFPETLVSSLVLPAMKGRPLAGDDARGVAPPLPQSAVDTRTFTLPDAFTMHWVGAPAVMRAKAPVLFHFVLMTPEGAAPPDMSFYMGMLGHAAFIKADGTVFAHIHPAGSISMAAFDLAQKQAPSTSPASPIPTSSPMDTDMPGMDMSGTHAAAHLPNEVTFPYGFPSPGRYRIFVQMKHGNTIETGIFDATVL